MTAGIDNILGGPGTRIDLIPKGPMLWKTLSFKLTLMVILGLVFTTMINLWASFPIVSSLAELSADPRQREVLSDSRLQLADLHRWRRTAVEDQLADCWKSGTLKGCQLKLGSLVIVGKMMPEPASSSENQAVPGEVLWPTENNAKIYDGTSWWSATFDFKPIKPLVVDIASILAAQDHLGLVIDGIKGSFRWTLLAASVVGVFICLGSIFVLSRKTRIQYGALQLYIRSLTRGGVATVPAVLADENELGVLAQDVYQMSLERAAAQKRALESERMSVWQTMARKVAHEIKNPLTPIALVGEQLGVIALRISELEIQRLIKESSRIISEEAQALDRMVREFTSFARLPKPQRDLRAVVQDFILRNSAEGGPRLVISGYSEPALASVDAAMLHQIFHNLVNNARLAKISGQVVVDFCLSADEKYWFLDVVDDGPGVPEDLREILFDAYVTSRSTGEKEKGMGLGLTISRQIATDHGGGLSLFAAGCTGTTMRITLPRWIVLEDPEMVRAEGSQRRST
ncbi:MAG: ATP-binding protein [Proteobacteria bacterium]|nr:ATP-binding protein [Pseudomonadota bacterium]